MYCKLFASGYVDYLQVNRFVGGVDWQTSKQTLFVFTEMFALTQNSCMYVCMYVAQLVRVCSWRLATSGPSGQSLSAGGPHT